MKFRILETKNKFIPQYRYNFWPLWNSFEIDANPETFETFEVFSTKEKAFLFINETIGNAMQKYSRNTDWTEDPKIHKVHARANWRVVKYIKTK